MLSYHHGVLADDVGALCQLLVFSVTRLVYHHMYFGGEVDMLNPEDMVFNHSRSVPNHTAQRLYTTKLLQAA